MVDWLWVWDIWDIVLWERKMMAENWAVHLVYVCSKKDRKLLKSPDINARWFITVRDSKEFLEELNKTAEKLYSDALKINQNIDKRSLKKIISNWMIRFIDRKIKRNPLISITIVNI